MFDNKLETSCLYWLITENEGALEWKMLFLELVLFDRDANFIVPDYAKKELFLSIWLRLALW